MNYSFEYLDIILLAMIAGFIFLRLRGILGKRTGYEEDISNSFPHEMPEMKSAEKPNYRSFDESAKKDFLEGAKVAYETIITNFSKGSLKEIKNLLDRKVLNQFQEAISNREKNGIKSETTFIGINSAEIKNHEQKDNVLEVTVDFISEIISCNRDKNSKILTGDPEKVKKVYDTWRFSRNLNSNDPNWILVETNIWYLSKKLSDKDIKVWKNFVTSKDKITPKDDVGNSSVDIDKSSFVIDLHGFGLDQANSFIEKTINDCFEKNVSRINVITGKGLRSKSTEDPYKSSELSILKHSIPDYISSNLELMKLIKKIDNKNEKNSGSFNIYLKSKNKFR